MVYVFDAASGEHIDTINDPTPAANGRFGGFISISGEQVLIGNKNFSAADSVQLRIFNVTTGDLVQTLHDPVQDVTGDFCHAGVFLDNGEAVVAAPLDDKGGAGVVYVYGSIFSTTTDADGAYDFLALDPGDYQVREIVKSGYVQTSPAGNGTYLVTLADGQNVIDLEFGNVWDSILLFSGSFENGQWNGQWVEDSQNDWFTSTQRATDGSYSAEVDGRATDATLTAPIRSISLPTAVPNSRSTGTSRAAWTRASTWHWISLTAATGTKLPRSAAMSIRKIPGTARRSRSMVPTWSATSSSASGRR